MTLRALWCEWRLPRAGRSQKSRVPLWNYPATYLLMGINIAVFAMMFPLDP
jgi:hypothetical protein